MQYTETYYSPIGNILLAADDKGITGLWFEGAKYFSGTLNPSNEMKKLKVLEQAKSWLDIYFSGNEPDFVPDLNLTGSPFRIAVWDFLRRIPYGSVVTYGEIASELAKQMGIQHMSAQAVGGAVGHNPISIIVPCHRVIGSNGSLTGYAGGVKKKLKLLKLENVDTSCLTLPKNRTAI